MNLPKQGNTYPRDLYYTGFEIVAAGAARAAGNIVVGNASAADPSGYLGDLKVGHIVQIDPFDLDGVGVGVAVGRPTLTFSTKLFVVTDVPKSVNETFVNTALSNTVQRRGGRIKGVPLDSYVQARVSGAVTAAKVGVGSTGSLIIDATNTNGYEKYMNLILGVPTTVAHLLTLLGAANAAQVVGLCMGSKVSTGVDLLPVQFGGYMCQGSPQ